MNKIKLITQFWIEMIKIQKQNPQLIKRRHHRYSRISNINQDEGIQNYQSLTINQSINQKQQIYITNKVLYQFKKQQNLKYQNKKITQKIEQQIQKHNQIYLNIITNQINKQKNIFHFIIKQCPLYKQQIFLTQYQIIQKLFQLFLIFNINLDKNFSHYLLFYFFKTYLDQQSSAASINNSSYLVDIKQFVSKHIRFS
ncbi:hypothetical protein ABPG74_001336 [Tetrahymena malaccensis]